MRCLLCLYADRDDNLRVGQHIDQRSQLEYVYLFRSSSHHSCISCSLLLTPAGRTTSGMQSQIITLICLNWFSVQLQSQSNVQLCISLRWQTIFRVHARRVQASHLHSVLPPLKWISRCVSCDKHKMREQVPCTTSAKNTYITSCSNADVLQKSLFATE